MNSILKQLDWSILFLSAWLSSRLLWSCDPAGFALDYLWGMLGIFAAGLWIVFNSSSNCNPINKTDIVVGLFFFGYIISELLGFSFGDQRAVFNCLWSAVFWGIAYILTRQIVTNVQRQQILIGVFLCVIGVLSFWAMYQRWVEYPILKAMYVSNPDSVLRSSGIWFDANSALRESFENRFFAFEPNASFSLTNSLAAFLVPWLILLLGQIFQLKTVLTKLAWGTIGAAVLTGIILTHSRSALIALLTAGAIGMIFVLLNKSGYVRGKLLLVSLIAVGAITAGTILTMLCPALMDSAVLSMEYRFQYWDTTLKIISAHPITGIGAGNFQNFYTQYMPITAGEAVSDPHNFLLEIAANAGCISAAIFWVLLGCITVKSVGRSSELKLNSDQTCDKSVDSKETSNLIPLSIAIAVFIGMIGGYGIGFVSVNQAPGPFGMILLSTTVTIAFLWNGLSQMRFSNRQLGLALMSLLLVLLTSGGIGYTSIAVAFWILVAMINTPPSESPRQTSDDKSESTQFNYLRLCSIPFGILFVLCYLTGFYPTIKSNSARDIAIMQTDAAVQREYLNQAIAFDPLDSQSHSDLATWYWNRWVETEKPEYMTDFISESVASLQRNPLSSVLWRNYGFSLYRYCQKTGDNRLINEAAAALQNACNLHRADFTAKAYLALLRITTNDPTPGQSETCEAVLKLMNVQPREILANRKLYQTALVNQSQLAACQYAMEIIKMSDNNPHKNRKISDSIKKELLQAITAYMKQKRGASPDNSNKKSP